MEFNEDFNSLISVLERLSDEDSNPLLVGASEYLLLNRAEFESFFMRGKEVYEQW